MRCACHPKFDGHQCGDNSCQCRRCWGFRSDFAQQHAPRFFHFGARGQNSSFRAAIYGHPSTHIWEDDVGNIHKVAQVAGGETQRRLFVVCRRTMVLEVHRILEEELWRHACIQVHHGETQVWNRGGIRPEGHRNLTRVARISDPDAVVCDGKGVSVCWELPLAVQNMLWPN